MFDEIFAQGMLVYVVAVVEIEMEPAVFDPAVALVALVVLVVGNVVFDVAIVVGRVDVVVDFPIVAVVIVVELQLWKPQCYHVQIFGCEAVIVVEIEIDAVETVIVVVEVDPSNGSDGLALEVVTVIVIGLVVG